MVIDIYNGKWGVPGKCGSRFFAKTELLTNWEIPTKYRENINDLPNMGLSAIVIRKPISHLESALQTEIMECWDNPIEIEKILLGFSNIDYGGLHFHPQFCKKVYNVWSKGGLRIVDLSKLSEFMEEILQHIPYDSKDYDFHNEPKYKTKKEIWDRCVELYPELMDKLVEYTNDDTKYYEALLNGDKSLLKII